MSNTTRKTRRKKKKSCGCSGVLVTALIFILLACLLIFTDVFSVLRQKIEMQLYPLNYREYIMKASEEYDLEPEFICAVIHTESNFKSDAKSPAGACGLMQIMPETFMWIADLKDADVQESEIFNPLVNMDYGCYYLRYLTDHYEDLYTACAAYNAGGIVQSWLSDPQYSTDGVTLYSIPYEETSQYVDKIRHAEEMYEKLYFSETQP
ncbi:MAG: lytic transglycosylase domain-containing protein [Ruminococcaceae bacterium]|nr:lytic transglycosylase domain-containing protein [Oscillospiraceae bacterium]